MPRMALRRWDEPEVDSLKGHHCDGLMLPQFVAEWRSGDVPVLSVTSASTDASHLIMSLLQTDLIATLDFRVVDTCISTILRVDTNCSHSHSVRLSLA
jgi:hypothetical protein